MAELCRFFGIIIRMYMEPLAPHHVPHLHAYYQDDDAIYDIEAITMLAGSLPRRQQRFVEAWIELHQYELLENWRYLQNGLPSEEIAPLT
ncbi:MAG: DUF4160 domain-containing protein [candidate division KSB1 bacterium]